MVTASTCTATPSSCPSSAAPSSAAASSTPSGRDPRIRSAARPCSVSGCTCTLRAPSRAARRTTKSRLSTLCWVSVKMRPKGVPDDRTVARFATVRSKAPSRPRIRSCSSGRPSIEIASTSTSSATGSQRAGLSSIPLDVTVVTMPSSRARASSSGSGR